MASVILPHNEAGSGPAVVLLHAGVADRSMWDEHLQPLAEEGLRVLALDLPGFGDAPPSTVEDAPWNDVLETMDALGIERAALVGNSFGALVALRVAAIAPERVSRLALISASAPDIEPSAELQAAWQAEEEAMESDDIDGAVRAVLDAWLLPDAPARLRERVAAMQQRALELQAAAPEVPEGLDPIERDPDALSRIGCPTLIATGRHDMPDFYAGAEALAAAMPVAGHAVVLDAGHLTPLEQPVAFRELLLSLMAM
ncbi:MAG TPA: alpha/beta fold hydrolase [Solirubrobacteraceae bacterium]